MGASKIYWGQFFVLYVFKPSGNLCFVKNLNISNTALVFLMTMPILYLCSEMLIKLKTKMKEGN